MTERLSSLGVPEAQSLIIEAEPLYPNEMCPHHFMLGMHYAKTEPSVSHPLQSSSSMLSFTMVHCKSSRGEGEKKHTNEDESSMLQLTRTQIVHRIKTTCLILCWSASCCLEELLWVMSTRALGVFCGRLFCTLTASHLELQLHHSDNIFTGLPSNFMVWLKIYHISTISQIKHPKNKLCAKIY